MLKKGQLFAHKTLETSGGLRLSTDCTQDICPARRQMRRQTKSQAVGQKRLRALRLIHMLFYKFVRCSTLQGLILHLLSLPPFQVLGGVESRGVLKKISDMLEVILKRIDKLSKLDNTSTSDAKRLDELSSAISRYTEFPSTGPCPPYTPCCLSAAHYVII